MEEKEIVLVDDDNLQYMLVKSVLKKIDSKIKITFFRNPEEALIYLLEKEEAKLPALILLDINMPEMTGWEFLEKYTNYEHKSKVVILSSSIDAIDITKAKTHPDVLEFCSKPLYLDKMNEIINYYTC